MKNSTKKLLAVFLTFALLFTSIATLMPKKATQVNALDDEDDVKTLYYFSDAAHATQYRTNILNATDVEVCYLYNWYGILDDFNTPFIEYYNTNAYTEISNAYVILEITNGYAGEKCHSVFQKLKSFFRTLKNNGCKTMFIYGTDESLFLGANGFLDYVDVHINTGMFDIFMLNVFYQYHCDNGYEMPLQNCTFILDQSLSSDIIGSLSGYVNWFINRWFIPYLNKYYAEEMQTYNRTYYDICLLHDIKIIYDFGDGHFVNIFTNEQFWTSSSYDKIVFYEYIDNDHIYSIGTTWISETYTAWWMETMCEARSYLNRNFPIYICDSIYCDTSLFDYPNVYTTNQLLDYYLVIEGFLLDNDLTIYNNWVGKCVITHKPLAPNPSGWLLAFYGDGGTFALSAWGTGEEEPSD